MKITLDAESKRQARRDAIHTELSLRAVELGAASHLQCLGMSIAELEGAIAKAKARGDDT